MQREVKQVLDKLTALGFGKNAFNRKKENPFIMEGVFDGCLAC